ncbi:hypothetical protein HL653_09110 [Sphingomonas sp. AP4-R1]|uniref:glucokinase n=1 Tax=Sphingomonas sp. AP4-R1 TaxID=2735134 RepID=UPI00149332F0|nr:glucokinase [Sphingomonas sp. AP4-R1]QJU57930.1 hypothetical protein HL653_09110 [Sphingomonas sp. AP4-R1]
MSDDWLLIDIDGGNARFALACGADHAELRQQRHYSSRDFVTATDCILHYGREAGITLRGLPTAVVISGPVIGDTVRVARSPWIISVRGLAYVMDRMPAVMNDSAAKLWSDLAPSSNRHSPLGGLAEPRQLPDGSKGGYLAVNFRSGLGAALLIHSPHGIAHAETEIGHIAFSPFGDVERTVWTALSGARGPVGWERALLVGRDDPIWAGTSLRGNAIGIARARAAMLGAFCGDAVLATGAWNGLLLHGAGNDLLAGDQLAAAFNERFEARAGYASMLRRVPRWRVEAREENLVGAANFLRARMKAGEGSLSAPC